MFISDQNKDEKAKGAQETARQERRYLPRWEVDNKIIYSKEAETLLHQCQSKDISATGVCLRTAQDIPPDAKLNLTIYLEENIEPIVVHGQVRWKAARGEENLVGIQFDRVNDKTSDLIFRYAFQNKRDQLMKNWFKGSF